MAYKVARAISEPTKVSPDAGVPGDWRCEFTGLLDDGTPHFVAIQFGSRGMTKAKAEELAEKILAALND